MEKMPSRRAVEARIHTAVCKFHIKTFFYTRAGGSKIPIAPAKDNGCRLQKRIKCKPHRQIDNYHLSKDQGINKVNMLVYAVKHKNGTK